MAARRETRTGPHRWRRTIVRNRRAHHRTPAAESSMSASVPQTEDRLRDRREPQKNRAPRVTVARPAEPHRSTACPAADADFLALGAARPPPRPGASRSSREGEGALLLERPDALGRFAAESLLGCGGVCRRLRSSAARKAAAGALIRLLRAWRKRVGVEPTKDRLAAPPGFEVRTPHRGQFSSRQ